MQPLVSSLSAGDCPVHRLRKKSSSFLTGAQDSHLQRVTIPEVKKELLFFLSWWTRQSPAESDDTRA